MSAPSSPSAFSPAEELTFQELDLDLVTGEAVLLELRPASVALRGLALALDLVVLLVAFWAISWLLVRLIAASDVAAQQAWLVTAQVLVLLVLPVTVETLSRGRSLGKLAAGLRVVRDDGGPIRLRQAMMRGLLALVETYTTFTTIAMFASLTNRRGKRLGDLLAGTYVVKERTSARYTPPVLLPPELQGWAMLADVSRVPDRLAMAARAYLGRLHVMHPASRVRIGLAVAGELATLTSPPPPPGVHPERFIAAVLAERSLRDLKRFQTAAAIQAQRAQRRAALSPLMTASSRLLGEERSASSWARPSSGGPIPGPGGTRRMGT